jgi:hypothetical protein
MPQKIEFKGTVHEFPDNFSQEQISSALRSFSQTSQPSVDVSQFDMSQQNEPQRQPPSNWDVAGDALGRQLPANILGAPVDIASMVIDAGRAGYSALTDTPMGPRPEYVGGSDWFTKNLLPQYTNKEDYTGGQKLLSNALTLGGEGLLGGAGLAAKSRNVGSAGPILKEMLEPYMKRPVSQVAQDAAVGAGAGAGLTGAEEMDAGPIATFLATMLGGMSAAPTAKVVERGIRGQINKGESVIPGTSKRTLDDVRQHVTESQVGDDGQIRGPLVTDKKAALQNIDRSIADADELGVADPTLGPASGDVGLSMLEVRQRMKNPQKFAERDQQIRTGIAGKFSEYFSNPEADVTAPQRASSRLIEQDLGQRQSKIDDMYGAENQAQQEMRLLQEQGQQIPASIQARRGAEGRASSALNEQLEGALDQRTTTKNQKFEESAKGAFVEAKTLADLVKSVDAEAPKLAPDAKLPDYIMKGIRKFIPQPGTLEGPNSTAGMIPADEVLKLRMYLDTEIRSLEQKGEFTKAKTLQSFKGKINETIELDPKFKEANEYYKQEYAPFFAQGYGKEYRDTVQRGKGTGKSDPGNIASFFLNKTSSAAEDLQRIVDIAPDKKAADDAIEMYFDADLARKELNPATIRNFIADNADVLPQGVKAKYQGIVKSMMDNTEKQNEAMGRLNELKQTIRGAETDLKSTERNLMSGPLGKMSRFDDDKYVGDIMGAKDRKKQLAEIKSRIGDDKEAMEGFKEATVRWLSKKIKGTDASGVSTPDTDMAGRPIVYSKLTNTFDENREALAEVFSPEEMNTLNRMHTIMSRQGNLARRATVGSDTAEKLTQSEKQVMDTIEVALKVKFGMLKGAGLNKVIKQVRSTVFGPSQRVVDAETLLTKMAFDPRVAKHVLEADPLTIENGKWISELNALIATGEAAKAEDEDVPKK